MIPMKITKDGKWMSRSDEAPCPHSLSKKAKQSGNYGLADDYRKLFPELALKPGEKPTEETVRMRQEQHRLAMESRGRGRGRPVGVGKVEMPQDVKAAAETVQPLETGEFLNETRRMFALRSALEAAVAAETSEKPAAAAKESETDQASSSTKVPMEDEPQEGEVDEFDPNPVKRTTKAGKNKTNGYLLFIKDRARKDGATGSLPQLMTKYNKDWTELPAEEKDFWKGRAKGHQPTKPVRARAPTASEPDDDGYEMTAKEFVALSLEAQSKPDFDPDKPIVRSIPRTSSTSSMSSYKTARSHDYSDGW